MCRYEIQPILQIVGSKEGGHRVLCGDYFIGPARVLLCFQRSTSFQLNYQSEILTAAHILGVLSG